MEKYPFFPVLSIKISEFVFVVFFEHNLNFFFKNGSQSSADISNNVFLIFLEHIFEKCALLI
jgi:hypothetical protein